MNYWLVKSEPGSYSWENLVLHQEEVWDGVRNYQARNYLKDMRLKDQVLFYHSGKDKSIVGVAEISEGPFPDPTDQENKDWVAVRIQPKNALKYPVTLEKIKEVPELAEMPLLKQSRLSVMPVSKQAFEIILKLSDS